MRTTVGKKLKIVLLAVFAAAAIAVVTFPYWASCGAKYQVCILTCDLRHMGSDFKQAACRGSCVTRKISCISHEALGR